MATRAFLSPAAPADDALRRRRAELGYALADPALAHPLDLHEILEERYARRSTILTSQIPVESWHDFSAVRAMPTPSSTA